MGLRDNLRLARLHLITDLSVVDAGVPAGARLAPRADAFAAFADRMYRAGVNLIQVRDHDAALLRAAVQAAAPVAVQHGALLAVGRDRGVAAALQADLLHLSSPDGDLETARRRLHRYSLVGRSTHSEEELAAAAHEGADWVTVGPVFQEGRAIGRGLIEQAARRWPLDDAEATPWFAVGGITLGNLDDVLGAGAGRIACSTAILGAPDPAATAAEFAHRLRRQAAPLPPPSRPRRAATFVEDES